MALPPSGGNTPVPARVGPGVTLPNEGADTAASRIDFFFDPVCPFAWMTSRWVVQVAGQRPLDVQWRFIALRMVNADGDYATDFPPGYQQVHDAGLHLLRVAAAVRAAEGNAAVGTLYGALGASLWERAPEPGSMLRTDAGTHAHAAEALKLAGLDVAFADAVGDHTHDAVIAEETELALGRAGRDVGTPILTFGPPGGPSFFGPVISRLPVDSDAVRLWDAVETIARFDSFAELKRSLRELPALPALANLRT